MQQIQEPSRVTPVMAETDVLVVGRGPGGLSAAVSAAREGVETMLVERYGGVVPLLHCMAVGTIMDGDTIQGIVTESKSERQAILAKRVIDATGDADIAFRAGAPFRKDPKEALMGVSVSFGCSGVDVEKLLEYTKQNPARIGDWAKQTSGKEEDLFYTRTGDAFTRATEAGEIPEGALRDGVTCREVNMSRVQQALDKQGVRIK